MIPFGRPSLRPHLALRQPAVNDAEVTARFLGTSAVLLRDRDTTVLFDGFVTRPGMLRVALGRIAPDEAVVRKAMERVGAREIAAVVCAHSHYDHALDAPVWARETGAYLVGSVSTANVGRGLRLPESQLRVVGEGDVLRYGRFELTFVESVHSRGDRFPGTVDRPLVPPARSGAWRTGACYSVFASHPRGTVLLHASAGYRPGALRGHRADVVYLGVGALGKQPLEFINAYWAEVVGATGARRVVLVHWDDFFVSLDQPLLPMPYLVDDLDRTVTHLARLAEEDDVEIVLPVAWQLTNQLDLTVNDRPASIRVASLNVCGLPSRLSPLADRAAHFCRAIEDSDVDVVTFQEVWGRRALKVLRAHLPSFPHLAWQRGVAGQPAGGLATFSRLPVGAVSYTSFRGAKAAGGWFRAKLALNSLMQGVLTVELAGVDAVVANTHLTANRDGDWSAGNRHHEFQRTQLGLLHAALRRVSCELLIIAGDFNIASDGPLYPLIVDGGAWRDPFAATDPTTYHVEFLPPGRRGRRIDYLLVRADAARYPLIDDAVLFAEPLALPDGRRMYVSDHVALTARVGMPGQAG